MFVTYFWIISIGIFISIWFNNYKKSGITTLAFYFLMFFASVIKQILDY